MEGVCTAEAPEIEPEDGEAVRRRGSARDYLESAKTDADNLPAGSEQGQPNGRANKNFDIGLGCIANESVCAEAAQSSKSYDLRVGLQTAASVLQQLHRNFPAGTDPVSPRLVDEVVAQKTRQPRDAAE